MEDLLILIGLYILFIIIVFYCECVVRRTKPKNNVHFYIARDKNGELFLYMGKPFRGNNEFHKYRSGCIITSDNYFYNFGLNKDDYANLKWEDEPVEVFLNLKD